MENRGRKFSSIISAAIFIGLEIAALNMLSASSTLQNIWINRASHRTMAFLWRGGESLKNYLSLNEQNRILSLQNEELSRRIRKYEKMEKLVEADSLVPDSYGGFSLIPAEIVKMSRNNQRNYIILNKGSEDGVNVEDGIITSHGVIGIIDAVDKHFSYGLTLMNVNVRVSVKLGRNGIVAPLSWDGLRTDRALVLELPLTLKNEKPDTVFTSGMSAVYPADIPLGLTGESRMVNGSTKELEVSLFENFSSLRYVTIAGNMSRKEMTAIENIEEQKTDQQ